MLKVVRPLLLLLQDPVDSFVMGPISSAQPDDERGSPSLQALCEACVAEALLEPRSCLQLLQFADAAGARALFRSAMTVSHTAAYACLCSSIGPDVRE